MAPRRSPHRLAVPPLQEVVVIALAAQRIARAVSTDSISEPVRAWLEERSRRQDQRFRRVINFLAQLVGCPVCTGWWASLAMSALSPGPARVRRGFSVAGVQVLLTLLERLLSEEGRAAIHHADIKQLHSAELSTATPA